MSCRSASMARGANTGPMRATVQFQVHDWSQPRVKDAKTVEKAKSRPPKPAIRRTLSLDTIIGQYLRGQWPKESDCRSTCINDKATQTPSSWLEEYRGQRHSGGHKRSASWGSTEHLREISNLKQQLQKRSRQSSRGCSGKDRIHLLCQGDSVSGATQTVSPMPLNRLTPRLRHSVEGLNLELEGVFVSENPGEDHVILDIPDGRRAPVPTQRCSSSSQSDLSPSPCPMGDTVALCPSPSPPPTDTSPSPWPSKKFTFQREPPEGCERVRVCEEVLCPTAIQPHPHSCPDPNKVNFTPHGGSAFCPVSLLKPLLPTVDFLFRGLSVSPVTGRTLVDPGADPTATTAV